MSEGGNRQIGVLRIYLRGSDRSPRTGRWWKSWMRRERAHQLVYAAHAEGLSLAMVRRSHLGFLDHGPIVDDAATDIPNPNAMVLLELAGEPDQLRAFVARHRDELVDTHMQFTMADDWSPTPAQGSAEQTRT